MKTLKQIGEFGLIERIAKQLTTDKTVIRGIGDDAAVISDSGDSYLLFTTDMLVEGVHFTRREASFYQIGRKSLAVNISDIAAMGGIPTYAVVSCGLPAALPLSAADEMIRGISTLAKEFGVNIVGGDTVRSPVIVINIALLGKVKKNELVLRSGAKVNDLIFVSGTLGNTRRLKQYNFIPRLKEARYLVKQYKPSSMIDLSDGLASDLRRISEQSRVGAVLFEELLPLAPGATARGALYDGEDFELLFTLPLERVRALYAKRALPDFCTCVGKIVTRKEGLTLIDKKARQITLTLKGRPSSFLLRRGLTPKGFTHF
ncbi:MAG: thiamine-phosphate kinase [Candidatus Omnitrophota bacterium]